jgi:branched-subunit amino acid ABC-type transport system permease component
MELSFVITQFLSGLAWSHSLLLVAAGLALIFGVINVLNFAHGTLFMIGTYIAYQFIVEWGANFWLGVGIAAILVSLMGGFIEFFLIKRVYGRKEELAYQLLLTYSVILIFNDLVKITWGSDFKSIPKPSYLSHLLDVGGGLLPSYYLLIICSGISIMVALWFVLKKTDFGRIIRAAALDRDMLEAMGVDTQKVYTGVFMLGTGIAGVGGALTGAMHTVAPGAGEEVIVEAIIVIVIGGLGSMWGAWIGALIIGQVNAFGILVLPRWSLLFIYAVMVLVFVFRPQGLLGKSEA